MHSRAGFTLMELSMVLVIVGLVSAGIVVGKSMVESAEMRTITTEHNLYVTAFKEFIDKYQAVPGDMNDAQSYWDSDNSCPGTASNTTPKTPTCNGDGNGMIGDWTNTGTSGNSEREWFRAWQQLANAALIEGLYTGVTGSASATDALVGVNVPASKTGRAGWTLLYMVSDGTTDTTFYNSAVGSHVLIYGAQNPGSFTDGAMLTPIYTKAIDAKIDDAMPFSGKMRVKKSTANTCTVSSAAASDYIATSSQTCQILFIMGM